MKYADFIAECAERSTTPNFIERFDTFADMARRMLSRKLRLIIQEKYWEASTNRDGIVYLDSGVEELIGVYRNGKELRKATPAELSKPNAKDIYIIKGYTVTTSNPSTSHQFHYFTPLRSFSDGGQISLVQYEPEICMYAVLFQAFAAEGNIEKAAQTAAWLDRLIEEINNKEQLKRQGGARVYLGAAA